MKDHWLPDDCTDTCMQCDREFTIKRRRHHCRMCGRIFCKRCSEKRMELPSELRYHGPERVCDSCADHLERQAGGEQSPLSGESADVDPSCSPRADSEAKEDASNSSERVEPSSRHLHHPKDAMGDTRRDSARADLIESLLEEKGLSNADIPSVDGMGHSSFSTEDLQGRDEEARTQTTRSVSETCRKHVCLAIRFALSRASIVMPIS